MSRGWRAWERVIARIERRARRLDVDPWSLWTEAMTARHDAWADAHLARLRTRREALEPGRADIPAWRRLTGWGPDGTWHHELGPDGTWGRRRGLWFPTGDNDFPYRMD